MNYKALAQEEAAFTLFAFKRTLRDRDQLTPTMVQFYERSIGFDVNVYRSERLKKVKGLLNFGSHGSLTFS